MSSLRRNICFAFVLFSLLLCFAFATDVTYDGRAIKINGERRVLLSGSIHYPRSQPEMWPDLINKSKEGGLDAIETYVFWNAHEPLRRQYDFTGNLDLIRFLKAVQDAGLYAILRIGPYVCAEWNYGGLPVWLHNMPGVTELRTDNEVFKNEMQNFITLIVDMAKKEKLFAIENEYGNVISSYGDAGKSYINWCSTMAESLDIGVPWIMCQESDAPEPMINTCNGWYCDSFTPTNPNTPKMWTENWTGWFKNWGGKHPHRTAEDVAFSVARFFQRGGTFQNYYMYHGGTNFGRTAGGPYISTTYDYDAPLDEFGNLNQPKWGHLKELHQVLKSMEKTLTYGEISNTDFNNSVSVTKYSFNGISSCFFSNANGTTDAEVSFEGTQLIVPAWSVSVLLDCKNEDYNTAKVNAQTSLMEKKEEAQSGFNWVWRPENTKETAVLGKGSFSADQLLEQKTATNDVSDYLWYMTSVDMNEQDLISYRDEILLRVNTSGHVLHAFVNGDHVGSQWATKGTYKFLFEQKIKLNPGKNQISLLSVTVGLQNYGPKFDTVDTGLAGVHLLAKKNDELIIKDLSTKKWIYKVGLHGEDSNLHSVESPSSSKWFTEKIPSNKMMTWYKTTFKAPSGSDAVVVDLKGMGKGHAWVNGKSIGRFWPSFIADNDGCAETCDYRGSYSDQKCVSKCGEPSQRWYHVPRSFLRADSNTLILFEEFGGNPSEVNFQTIKVGSICANAYEGRSLDLTCHGNGRTISAITFASFGDPQGSCGSFEKGICDSENLIKVVEESCLGKANCSIYVSEKTLGSTACGAGTKNRLAVEAICS
ncbi:hypothetical protein MKX01_026692 [Papaver californicum]|nr:hypothetical protein MKX01_026692 [Papaver californicum]